MTNLSKARESRQKFLSSFGQWAQGIGLSSRSIESLVSDPFSNHVWVFAAAMMIAQVGSQAPYSVFIETEEELRRRAARVKRGGRKWLGPRAAKNRSALQRHNSKSLTKRMVLKGLEEFPEHEVNVLMDNPNPFQDRSALIQFTLIWLSTRGELFWVFTDENNEEVSHNNRPARIWPISPDCMKPVYTSTDRGELIGWEMSLPHYHPKAGERQRLLLNLDEVAQFKLPNPNDPVRGISPLRAALDTLRTDLLNKRHSRKLLENDGTPKGVLMHDDTMDPGEEKALLRKWEERHGGTDNSGRTAMLTGGFQYQQLQLTSTDLDSLETQRYGREEILALMRVPKSVLGITDFINYATQLGQDRNFWDKGIFPWLRLMESVLDRTLLFNEPDSTVGMFDVRSIEALKADLADKITTAKSMVTLDLHMPPRTAYEVLDIEIPEYEGDDVALVPGISSVPVSVILTEEDEEEAPGGQPLPPNEPSEDDEDEDRGEADEEPDDEEGEEAKGRVFFTPQKRRKEMGGAKWRRFLRTQVGIEKDFRRKYRKWNREERRVTLERFESQAANEKSYSGLVGKQLDLTAILIPLETSQTNLVQTIQPSYNSALDATYELTSGMDLGGVPVFELDNPSIQTAMRARVDRFKDTTPVNLRVRLEKILSDAIAEGQSVDELRTRLKEHFAFTQSHAKSLQVARTESGGFMNNVREVMFVESGFTKGEWVTAGDEVVRTDHIDYGDVGPVDFDFNFLEVSGKTDGGILSHPHDVRCNAADQIVNCRCIKIPVE